MKRSVGESGACDSSIPGGPTGSIQASMIIGRMGRGMEGAYHLLQIDRTYSFPLTSSHIRPFMTNNTSQQRLITCCQWQRINHTINFHRVVVLRSRCEHSRDPTCQSSVLLVKRSSLLKEMFMKTEEGYRGGIR